MALARQVVGVLLKGLREAEKQADVVASVLAGTPDAVLTLSPEKLRLAGEAMRRAKMLQFPKLDAKAGDDSTFV